jgi:hypothetical protein
VAQIKCLLSKIPHGIFRTLFKPMNGADRILVGQL